MSQLARIEPRAKQAPAEDYKVPASACDYHPVRCCSQSSSAAARRCLNACRAGMFCGPDCCAFTYAEPAVLAR
jgi:hypothetical protein